MKKIIKTIDKRVEEDPVSAEELKLRFAPQSIPSSDDFASLIDLADAGYSQAGAAYSRADAAYSRADDAYSRAMFRGMIIMFTGSEAPVGWVFCDNSQPAIDAGAPDLRGRFIVGQGAGTPVPSNATAMDSSNLSGMSFTAEAQAKLAEVTVSLEGTALQLNQIPEHDHESGVFYLKEVMADVSTNIEKTFMGGFRQGNHFSVATSGVPYLMSSIYEFPALTPMTSKAGSGAEHVHEIEVHQSEHIHEVSITPPYYALAFIMKL